MAYFFILPVVTELTENQQMALDDTNPIAISGGAGTGKTVVSLWRHIQNIKVLNKSSMIVTFTKSLQFYLANSSRSVSQAAFKYVWHPFVIYTHKGAWKVDEIIVDEAQDLSCKHLTDMKKYATHISYGADFNQQLYKQKVTQEEIIALFPQNIEYDLQQNFRNSYHILNFTKAVLNHFRIPQNTLDELYDKNKGIKPIMFITNNFDKEIDKIIELINEFRSETHNIAILLPFADGKNNNGEIWDFTYSQCVEKYYNGLSNRGISCSHYYNKMNTDNIQIDNVHITTFKSAKGLEFNTVIIPQFDNFSENIKKFSSEEEYYVTLTRAKRNLYLISHNELDFLDNSTVEIEYLDARR